MKVKQVELKQDDGSTMIAWIDSKHAIIGRRHDLNLGEGERSPIMQVTEVLDTEQDADEIKDREINRRNFGSSINEKQNCESIICTEG